MLDAQLRNIYSTKLSGLRHLWSRMKIMAFRAYKKSCRINRTQAYLIMSHDSDEGIVNLRDDKPDLQLIDIRRADHA
jgi:hypothetical protein